MIKDKILDFLFPPFCVACGGSGEWWCSQCRQEVQLLNSAVCPRCLSLGQHECHGDLPFNHVWAIGFYHDPKLRSAITALKFHGTSTLQNSIKLFLEARQLSGLPADGVLVPMPLADKRLKERGFNQAELIARIFCDCLPQASLNKSLKRVAHRDPQSSVEHDLAARQLNIKNCFKAIGQVPKHVILVDDVITTGATAAEAAYVFLAAGAESVSVLTLAIGA
ncbi:MAG: ComF family protein [Patescibacteria group bacterium]